MAHPLPPVSRRRRATVSGAILLFALLVAPAFAEPPVPADPSPSRALAVMSPGRSFAETDGAGLYAGVCQGCHMRDGRGATGAGAYPSLAGDVGLRSAAYAIGIVLRGRKGMPAVGRTMTDGQVAAVLNYVRGHFGNSADDEIAAEHVRAARALPEH